MKQDDSLWKSLLEDIFDDFLPFFFKGQAADFDLGRGFEFLDKELEQIFPAETSETAHPRFVDKLVKVFTKSGQEEWILVHVEVQGYNDPDFSKRMFTYFYRILDKYNKPVTSIAIFTDPNKSFKPDEYRYSFMGVEAIFRYNVYKVIEQDKDELMRSTNPFAIIILTVLAALQKGRLAEEEILKLKLEIARALFKHAVPKSKIRVLLNFLRYYIPLEKPENVAKFEEEISIITNKNTTTMGLEEFLLQRARKEVREEVTEEKNTAFVKSLLANSNFDDEKIAAVADVTVAFVQKVKALQGIN